MATPKLKHFVHLILSLEILAFVAAGADKNSSDLADYRTVKTAITTTVQPMKKTEPGVTGFLGIEATANPKGVLVITAVAEGSPAAQADVHANDLQLGRASCRER